MMSSTKPLVVVAAGGTGGHMFPAQAFADEMHARGWTVALVTDERGAKYATNFPADWRLQVDAATFGSKLPHKLLASALKLRKGTAEAAIHLTRRCQLPAPWACRSSSTSRTPFSAE